MGETPAEVPIEVRTPVEAQTSDDTKLQQLRKSELHWPWKAGVRTIFGVLNIVALGCACSVVAKIDDFDTGPDTYTYYFDWNYSSVGGLVMFVLSFLWCLCWVVIPLIRKPPRALHPGIAVGFDLLLWLGFITAALFSLGAVASAIRYGSDGELADPNWYNYERNYTGNYYLAPNNTWIYNITYTSRNEETVYYNYTTEQYEYDVYDRNTIMRNCTPAFTTCMEQDNFVNSLWQQRPRWIGLELIVNIVEWLGVVVHFALFVWACVDCHRYNRKKYVSKEKAAADKILADLEKKGLITIKNGVVTQTSPKQ